MVVHVVCGVHVFSEVALGVHVLVNCSGHTGIVGFEGIS